MKGTHKYTEAYLMCFDNHRCLSQSEESKYMWTHSKDCIMWQFWLSAPGWAQERKRVGVEGMVRKLSEVNTRAVSRGKWIDRQFKMAAGDIISIGVNAHSNRNKKGTGDNWETTLLKILQTDGGKMLSRRIFSHRPWQSSRDSKVLHNGSYGNLN